MKGLNTMQNAIKHTEESFSILFKV